MPARFIGIYVEMSSSDFAHKLLAWYDQHGRHDLPWQHAINPYRVWLSEIMLQQTQVATVIPYFERFIERFPTVRELAEAQQDDVMHLWSGLGYYSRARNLLKTAQLIVTDHRGQFPNDVDALQSLPGIGRSTAGAICATAFEKRAAILDGNVKRVLARHFAVEGWPGNNAVSKQLWELTEQITPTKRVRAYTQAIMDLGATLCTRSKPGCERCPLSASCLAFNSDSIANYPGRKPKKVLPIKTTHMLIIENADGKVLLQKRPPAGIWGGLWSFPEVSDYQHKPEQMNSSTWPVLRHTFSHFHLDITPVYSRDNTADTEHVREAKDSLWYNLHDPQKIGLAAPVNKLLNMLKARQQAQQQSQ